MMLRTLEPLPASRRIPHSVRVVYVLICCCACCGARARGCHAYTVPTVSRDATQRDIKTAFRRAALRYHPDKSSAAKAAEKFGAAKDAFDVLSDAQRRYSLDTVLHREAHQRAASTSAGSTAHSSSRPAPGQPRPASARAGVDAVFAQATASFSAGERHQARTAQQPQQRRTYRSLDSRWGSSCGSCHDCRKHKSCSKVTAAKRGKAAQFSDMMKSAPLIHGHVYGRKKRSSSKRPR